MPVDPQASVRISAFQWVPPFAQGHVRDLRARWALEEAGVPYAVRKLDAAAERPADYFEEQPFGQVPSYRDDTVSLFESGAIVLHVGRNREALVPITHISDYLGRAAVGRGVTSPFALLISRLVRALTGGDPSPPADGEAAAAFLFGTRDRRWRSSSATAARNSWPEGSLRMGSHSVGFWHRPSATAR